MIKAILFDFDGVILDDAHIKVDAFNYLFPKEFDETVIPILDQYTKQSRKIIIQKCIEAIELNHSISLSYEEYLDRYSNLTQEKVLSAPEIKGATKALDTLSEKYKLFVVTTTPDEQINEIIKKRNFHQFTEIFGSDRGSKPEIAKELLQKYNINSHEVVFVGDGMSDLTCAREFNFEFIGIINQTNNFNDRPDIKYKEIDLQNIVSIIEKIDHKWE